MLDMLEDMIELETVSEDLQDIEEIVSEELNYETD